MLISGALVPCSASFCPYAEVVDRGGPRQALVNVATCSGTTVFLNMINPSSPTLGRVASYQYSAFFTNKDIARSVRPDSFGKLERACRRLTG